MELIDQLFPPSLPTILKGTQVRAVLGVSKTTFSTMVRDGRLPRPLRLGKASALFSTAEIRKALMALYEAPAGRAF